MELDLVGTNVTQTGLKQLAKLPKLRSLKVSADSFSEADVAELRAALPGVRISRWRKDASGNWRLVRAEIKAVGRNPPQAASWQKSAGNDIKLVGTWALTLRIE
jgi:hypothetical protein